MARLVNWPVGVRANAREPLGGPRTVSAGSTTSVSNFVQTFGSPFGLWKWRFSFPPLRGDKFRRYRGWITSLHGGANATRVSWCEWDQMSFASRGIVTDSDSWKRGQPWSNGMPWSNGQTWHSSNPVVSVASPLARGATTIRLATVNWGGNLDVGDMLGFMPFHLGWYMVTERIEAGRYRIWPPLDKAVASGDFATLNPVMAARLENEEGANAPRGAALAEGLNITLVQVKDYDVREYFAD